MLEPSWNLTLQNLVEFWWNPHGTLPQTSPDHPAALEEIGVRSTTGWWNPGGNLVELSRNLTSNHPLQPWWNLCGTLPQSTPNPGGNLADGGTHLVEPWWNSGGTLVEPWWNLSSGSPRTTPEPIWAVTPKLSAVGEKTCQGHPERFRASRLQLDGARQFESLRRAPCPEGRSGKGDLRGAAQGGRLTCRDASAAVSFQVMGVALNGTRDVQTLNTSLFVGGLGAAGPLGVFPLAALSLARSSASFGLRSSAGLRLPARRRAASLRATPEPPGRYFSHKTSARRSPGKVSSLDIPGGKCSTPPPHAKSPHHRDILRHFLKASRRRRISITWRRGSIRGVSHSEPTGLPELSKVSSGLRCLDFIWRVWNSTPEDEVRLAGLDGWSLLVSRQKRPQFPGFTAKPRLSQACRSVSECGCCPPAPARLNGRSLCA